MIGDAALLSAFSPLELHRSALLAVSGGPDSMALMYLIRRWLTLTRSSQHMISIATVDHRLRLESAGEAAFVAEHAKSLAFPHAILTWEGEKPRSGIQAAARAARYRLLTSYCRAHGISALVTAHTQDDQAETILMRLRRGSGLDGLAAIAKISFRDGVAIIRPMLGFSKARLVTYLNNNAIPFIEDPSNADRAFERVRLRHTIKTLAAAGITPQSLARSSQRVARSREALDRIARSFLDEHFHITALGQGIVSLDALKRLPEDLALRAMSQILALISGTGEAPRMQRLERQLPTLMVARFGITIGGCFVIASSETLNVYRELGRMHPQSPPFEPAREVLWDGRFLLRLSGDNEGTLKIAPLGNKGWNIFVMERRRTTEPCASMIKGNRLAAISTPALWRGDDLVCAPLLGYDAAHKGRPRIMAELAPTLAQFLKLN